ncbi:hypothetical protein [Methylobacterium tardum]|nr:hypothetical protein [Methylobacterium tardum]
MSRSTGRPAARLSEASIARPVMLGLASRLAWSAAWRLASVLA